MTHKAVLLFHEKFEYADGDIVEVKAWAVVPSPAKPEGIKYSLVYIGKDGTRILGYDNAEAQCVNPKFNLKLSLARLNLDGEEMAEELVAKIRLGKHFRD